ncbi:hypothetical protein T310_5900, partial [Rasamsonia emersonii CBS 393.64]
FSSDVITNNSPANGSVGVNECIDSRLDRLVNRRIARLRRPNNRIPIDETIRTLCRNGRPRRRHHRLSIPHNGQRHRARLPVERHREVVDARMVGVQRRRCAL